MLKMNTRDKLKIVVTGLSDEQGLTNAAFIRALTKKYHIIIDQKLEDADEYVTKSDTFDFYTDQSISILEKIQKLSEEQGLIITPEEIEFYIR